MAKKMKSKRSDEEVRRQLIEAIQPIAEHVHRERIPVIILPTHNDTPARALFAQYWKERFPKDSLPEFIPLGSTFLGLGRIPEVFREKDNNPKYQERILNLLRTRFPKRMHGQNNLGFLGHALILSFSARTAVMTDFLKENLEMLQVPKITRGAVFADPNLAHGKHLDVIGSTQPCPIAIPKIEVKEVHKDNRWRARKGIVQERRRAVQRMKQKVRRK